MSGAQALHRAMKAFIAAGLKSAAGWKKPGAIFLGEPRKLRAREILLEKTLRQRLRIIACPAERLRKLLRFLSSLVAAIISGI